MRGSRSLLETVQGLLERTYAMRTGVRDLAPFVIGDEGFRTLYAEVSAGGPGSSAGAGARTLLRETPEGVRACIYYPDELIRSLEAHPPQDGLRDANVEAFATLVEELDHLLCVAERVANGRPISLLELELHANVSKYLVLERFLAGPGRRLPARKRIWLRWHLFDKGSYQDDDPEVRHRYTEAARWAVRFLDGLEKRPAARRIELLRSFHAGAIAGKLELIHRLSA